MTEFKVGDVVEIDLANVDNDAVAMRDMAADGIHPQSAYTIASISRVIDDGNTLLLFEGHRSGGWYSYRFKLYDKKAKLFGDLAERDRAIAESFLLGFSLS